MAKKKLKYNSVEELAAAFDKLCEDSYNEIAPMLLEMSKCTERLNQLRRNIQKHHSKERSKLKSLLNSNGFIVSKPYSSLYSAYYKKDPNRWRHYNHAKRNYETLHDYIQDNYLFVGNDPGVKEIAKLAQNIDDRIGKYFLYIGRNDYFRRAFVVFGKITSIDGDKIDIGAYSSSADISAIGAKYKYFNSEYAMRKYIKFLKEKYPNKTYNRYGFDFDTLYTMDKLPEIESEKKNGEEKI